MKSDFVATASHELRSPLTSIKGFVELLGRSEGLERARARVRRRDPPEHRPARWTWSNDLLDVARLEAGEMEVHPRLFDLDRGGARGGGADGPQLVEKDQRLELDLPPGLPRALADPSRVRQIVTNLVSNAHQYTGEGGRITISVDQAEDRARCSPWPTAARGMTPGGRSRRVFDRFARREGGGGGTGPRALDRQVAGRPAGRLDRA